MVDIKRWIDIDGEEFKSLEDSSTIRKIINMGLEAGAITLDNNGYMWNRENPIHAEKGSELVGIRYSKKAVN